MLYEFGYVVCAGFYEMDLRYIEDVLLSDYKILNKKTGEISVFPASVTFTFFPDYRPR